MIFFTAPGAGVWLSHFITLIFFLLSYFIVDLDVCYSCSPLDDDLLLSISWFIKCL